MKVEIFTSADGIDIIANNGDNYHKINDNDALIDIISNIVENDYPKADKRLKERYADKFSRVRRFCKCNFAVNDQVPDIDVNKFNFEFVNCPLRGECDDENVICNPELSTGLTVRETEIVREFAKGKMAKEVAFSLRITQRTAETHKRNIYAKIGINTAGELVNWAHHHQIIN
ncbi:MAG: helix-turn-helix transcriptional regulator [Ignavibacteria bacterium]|nr:helix-turn-helix transcriptional regulator [Ignavibacteria bacterium]